MYDEGVREETRVVDGGQTHRYGSVLSEGGGSGVSS